MGVWKEAAVPRGLQRGSLCGEDWSPWEEPSWPRGGKGPGPITKTTRRLGLRHQLTIGSTSPSRSNSSWISSVLPESLLATELGDGEFLENMGKRGQSVRGAPEGIRGRKARYHPYTVCPQRGPALNPAHALFWNLQAHELHLALETSGVPVPQPLPAPGAWLHQEESPLGAVAMDQAWFFLQSSNLGSGT